MYSAIPPPAPVTKATRPSNLRLMSEIKTIYELLFLGSTLSFCTDHMDVTKLNSVFFYVLVCIFMMSKKLHLLFTCFTNIVGLVIKLGTLTDTYKENHTIFLVAFRYFSSRSRTFL